MNKTLKISMVAALFLIISLVILRGFPKENVSSETDQPQIASVLNEIVAREVLKPEYNGKVFCSQHIYESEYQGDKIESYIWAYCEEYYKKENGEITMGSATSLPIKISLLNKNSQLEFLGKEVPVDGHQWADSVRKIFPEKYAQDVINGFDIKNLTPSPREQAFEYFKIQQD